MTRGLVWRSILDPQTALSSIPSPHKLKGWFFTVYIRLPPSSECEARIYSHDGLLRTASSLKIEVYDFLNCLLRTELRVATQEFRYLCDDLCTTAIL